MFANVATIDGPPASGKSTMAAIIAQKYNLIHLDSGAIFRAITIYCMGNNVDLRNPDNITQQLPLIKIQLSQEKVFLNGQDVSDMIRTPEVTRNTTLIFHIPKVREFVKEIQKSYARIGNVICDGRKVGTEIFPNAKVKFYLTADRKIRAERRYLQLLNTGITISYHDVYKELKEREEYERIRGMLIVPENSLVIDNSKLSIEQTQRKMEAFMLPFHK